VNVTHWLVGAVLVMLVPGVGAAQTLTPSARTLVVAVQGSGHPEEFVSGGSTGLPGEGIGGVTTAFVAAVGFPMSGRYGLGAEFSLGRSFHDVQTATIWTASRQHREHIAAVMTQVGIGRRGPVSFVGSAGPAIVVEQTTSTRTDFRVGSPPRTGAPFTSRHSRIGISGGVDVFVALGERLALVAPLRMTYVRREDNNDLSLGLARFVYRGGAGLAVTF
jgi:hypothetical protein